MLLTENSVKFCMQEVFKCTERRMMRSDEEWTKAQAWGCPCHPKKYSRSASIKAWGCPRHPLFINKISGHLSLAIFLLLHKLCAVLGAYKVFVFYFILLCFVLSNKCLDHRILVWERETLRCIAS